MAAPAPPARLCNSVNSSMPLVNAGDACWCSQSHQLPVQQREPVAGHDCSATAPIIASAATMRLRLQDTLGRSVASVHGNFGFLPTLVKAFVLPTSADFIATLSF